MTTGYKISVNNEEYDISELWANDIHDLFVPDPASSSLPNSDFLTTSNSVVNIGNYTFQNSQQVIYSLPDSSNKSALRGSTGGLYKNGSNDLFIDQNIIGKLYYYNTPHQENEFVTITQPAWAKSFRAIVIAGGGGGGGGCGADPDDVLSTPFGGGGGGQGGFKIFRHSISSSDTLAISVGKGGTGGYGGMGSNFGENRPGTNGSDGNDSQIKINGETYKSLGGGGGDGGFDAGRNPPLDYNGIPFGHGGGAGGGLNESYLTSTPNSILEEVYSGQQGGGNYYRSGGNTFNANNYLAPLQSTVWWGTGHNGGKGFVALKQNRDPMVLRLDGVPWQRPSNNGFVPSNNGFGKGGTGGGGGGENGDFGDPDSNDYASGKDGQAGKDGLILIVFYPTSTPPALPSL